MKRLLILLALTVPAAAGDRYIVEFAEPPLAVRRAPASLASYADAHARFRAAAHERRGIRIRNEFFRTFNGAAVEVEGHDALVALTALPGVLRIHPDIEVKASALAAAVPSVTKSLRPRTTATGDGIVVAVIDTGIDYTHPALAGKVIGGWDFVNDDSDAMDDSRHGTHVAGIIAAQGETTGVAPGVKLLSYKILDAGGHGDLSNIIGALELALDPNSDGDTSDRADVVNLSLGGAGHADDPASRAVNNAVTAGIVVVVAVGNAESFHAIGSPGLAEGALSVGAWDATDPFTPVLAPFTSCGPAAGSMSVKPDLLAPGVSIRSTVLNHKYQSLSGTSMATPYVAGLVALLLEEHPDWTPARVKSALATTADPLELQEVMAQGSGRVEYAKARGASLTFAPTQFSLGLNGTTTARWTSSRTVTIRNEAAVARTLQARVEGGSGAIVASVEPAELTLGAGESRELRLDVEVDNAALGAPPSRSLSFGGTVVLSAGGVDEARLPWAFVRAARATVRYDGAFPMPFWMGDAGYGSVAVIGQDGVETLLEPGLFDLAVVAGLGEDVRVFIAERQQIEGDVLFALDASSAPHEVRVDTFPEGDSASARSMIRARLLLPGTSFVLPVRGKSLHASSFSERFGLLLTESRVDAVAATVHVAQYPAVRPLTAPVVLRANPGDFLSQRVRLEIPAGSERREVTVMPRDWPRRDEEFGPAPDTLSVSDVPDWTLFLTDESHSDFASGVQFAVRTDGDSLGVAAMNTPMIRRRGDRFVASREFLLSSLPAEALPGETMTFGDGASFVPTPWAIDGNGMTAYPELVGQRNETRRRETLAMRYTVTDRRSGEHVASGAISYGTSFLPIHRGGELRAELTSDALVVDGRPASGTLTMEFDTTDGQATPAHVTSLTVLDGSGRHAVRLPRNGNGSLVFSARGEIASQTSAFFRPRGRQSWVQLTPVIERSGEPAGTLYRIDLRDALQFEGDIELSIGLVAEDGSTTAWHLAPAFVSTVETSTRKRRAVR